MKPRRRPVGGTAPSSSSRSLLECAEPGASVASVALSHGINANVVHKWRRQACGGLPVIQAPIIRSCLIAASGMCACARYSHRVASWRHQRHADLASGCRRALRRVDARAAQVIRVDALWLATEPLDMRAGTETALARVVSVFGAARPHHAYLFANRRANRMKVLVHDGIGVWLAARRLNSGKFVWPRDAASTASLTRAQFDALVLGLPWQRLADGGVITVV
jgi:transposase